MPMKKRTETTLHAVITRRGLSIAEAAHICGAKYTTFWRHCNGSRTLFGDVAARYADALGIPRSELRPDLWPQEAVPMESGHEQSV